MSDACPRYPRRTTAVDARASTARAADPNRPLTDAVALAATRDRRRIVAPDMSRSVVCGSPGYSIYRSRNRTGIVKKSEGPARSMLACGARAVGMTTPTDGSRGRGRGGGLVRGRGDRSRGGSRPLDPKVRLSKNLSQILRHGVVDEGLADCLDAEGFVPLARVLALPRFRGVGADEIRALVAADRKGRFELRDGVFFAYALCTGKMTKCERDSSRSHGRKGVQILICCISFQDDNRSNRHRA